MNSQNTNLIKTLTCVLLGGFWLTIPQAVQAQSEVKPDTLKRKIEVPADTVVIEDVKTGEKRTIKIHLPGKEESIISIEKTETPYSLDTTKNTDSKNKSSNASRNNTGRGIFGITFSRIDLGLTKPMVGSSFSMEGPNERFRYRPGKTYNFGFDFLQAGYRFNREFKVFLSAGIDWTYLRLRNNLIFDADGNPYSSAIDSEQKLSKNRLTSTYLRLPLTFEFRPNGGRTRIAVGPMGGFLLKGTQRYKVENGSKVKTKGDYDYAPFQYGMFARFGVGAFGIYGKYYFNDMFEHSPSNAGFQNLTFGLTLGF